MSSEVTRPLSGIRVLALEQMQALPFATQLLARLGADVVKVEPISGESGRASLPAAPGPDGVPMGATFLRNNLSKRSIAVDIRTEAGRELVLGLAETFDVFAENFRAGALERRGLGFSDVRARNPKVVYVSVSGFGATESPYRDWPAYASIVEAMSGIYDFRLGDAAPLPSPAGSLGDIGAGMFAVIGVLAALRQRELTDNGAFVDIAMLDAMVSMTDIVTSLSSMGVERGRTQENMILNSFRAADGWFILQVGREEHFERLCQVLGTTAWLTDPRFATRAGWSEHLDEVIRPAVETWAATRTRREACADLSAMGVAAGPSYRADEVTADPHIRQRGMLVEVPIEGGPPVLVPGSPVRVTSVAPFEDRGPPMVGEHTEEVLAKDLGLTPEEIRRLAGDGVIHLGADLR